MSLPPADDSDELDDEEPLFGAGFTTAFACDCDEGGGIEREIDLIRKILFCLCTYA